MSGTHLVLDDEAVATTAGVPTDIGAFGNVVGVIDGGSATHLTQFAVDEDGNLKQLAVSVVNKVRTAS